MYILRISQNIIIKEKCEIANRRLHYMVSKNILISEVRLRNRFIMYINQIK